MKLRYWLRDSNQGGIKYMKVIKHENEFGLIISFKELDKQFDV